MKLSTIRCSIGAVILYGVAALSPAAATNVLTYHNDNASIGVNASEAALTPALLTVNTFGKKYSTAVDGQVYAQPLYKASVVVTSGAQAGTHDLVFVATEHDSLYAIDASNGVIVWQTSFLTNGISGATSITTVPNADTGTTDLTPEVGITSTPVIDSAANFLYLTAKTKQIVNGDTANPHYVYTLYKIDITSGNATANANILSKTVFADTIYNGSTYTFRTNTDPSASQDPFVVGTGDGAITVNGQSRVYLNALRELNRPGLVLNNGIIYVAFASHGDNGPYHGIILGFNASTLAITANLNLTPNGGLGGIWESGGIPALDSSGNIYVMTGNGTFDGASDGNGGVTGLDVNGFPSSSNYGDCFVKISADNTTSASNQNANGWGLKVVDYFSPFNNHALDQVDSDLGSGGCVVLPDSAGGNGHQSLLVGTGKQGKIYLIDRTSMGGFSASTDGVVQSNVSSFGSFDTPAFFSGHLYYAGVNGTLLGFPLANGVLSTNPQTSTVTYGFPGATPSISANGTSNGIIWTINRGTAELRAYSVDNFGDPIWTSSLASNSRDAFGAAGVKFSVPTVADGRVFVGTASSLVGYSTIGNNNASTPTLATQSATSVGGGTATLNGTVNPNGIDTTVSFQYGTTTSYGSTTGTQAEGNGVNLLNFSASLSGLTSLTTYHYRAKAVTVNGTTFGSDMSFTTIRAQVIESDAASYLGVTGAQVSEGVNPNGLATTAYFEYGTSTGYGSQTVVKSIGKGKVPVTVFGIISGLSPNIVYHFRIVTTSSAGTFYGPDQTFTTLPFTTTRVVAKTDTAAGTNGATFASFGTAAINGNDRTAFAGALTIGRAGVTSLTDEGIWADDGTGTHQLIARTGTVRAPGTTATFTALSDPVYNVNQDVAFRGTLKIAAGAATKTTATGIWSNSSGSLALVAQQGGAAPGSGGTFSALTGLGLSDNNGVVLLATLAVNTGAGITAANNVGVWQGNTTGNLALKLRTGQGVGGKTISKFTFLPTLAYVNGQTRNFAPNSGDLACEAAFTDRTTGIVSVISGTAALVKASGTPAIDVANANYAAFGNPIINTDSHIAFAGTLTGTGITAANNFGIWAADPGGNIHLVARTGTTAPGTASLFVTLGDPCYNQNEAVAFRGTLKVAIGQATRATSTGIWCNSTGTLARVAQTGTQAPGCPPGATFATFSKFTLPDQGDSTNLGGVVMLATLNLNTAAGVTPASTIGIWAVDTAGHLQLIARTGDLLDGKTITALEFLSPDLYIGGQSRNVANSTGDLTYLATFSDKTSAIYKVVFP